MSTSGVVPGGGLGYDPSFLVGQGNFADAGTHTPPVTAGTGGVHHVPAPAAPVGFDTVINNMVAGNWDVAIRNLLGAGFGLPADANINTMFNWGLQNMTDACKRSYATSLVNLMKLPTGKELVGQIIRQCHENIQSGSKPSKLFFVNNRVNHQFIWGYDAQIESEDQGYPRDACFININWDFASQSHTTDEWILLATSTTNDNQKISFVNAEVSVPLILAHELNHSLWALQVKGDAVKPENLYEGSALLKKAQTRAQDDFYKPILVHVEQEWKATLNDEEDADVKNAAWEFFANSWNGGNFVELINILPIAGIDGLVLPATVTLPTFYIGDGLMIGEALQHLDGAYKPTFTDLSGKPINLTYTGKPDSGFIRFSHWESKSFNKALQEAKQKLAITKEDLFLSELGNILECLVSVIKRKGNPNPGKLGALLTLGDLPKISPAGAEQGQLAV